MDKDLFSCLPFFCSLVFLSFVKEPSDQKTESKPEQQVRSLKGCRNLQVNWKAISDKETDLRSFKGFSSQGQLEKVRME